MGLFSNIVSGDFGFGDVVETAVGVKTLIDLFDDDETVPSAVSGAGANISAIARALQDPDDPMFRKLEEQESTKIARDYAKALRDIGVANRRMMARTGGLGILDPERRDEALASAYTKSFADRKALAREQARAYLSSALTANQAVAGAYAPMIAANQSNLEREASGMQMLLDLSQNLFKPDTGINFDVSLMNPPGLSFSGVPSSRPAVSTYTTPGSI